MKLLYIVCLSVLLSGCGWFNQDEPVQENHLQMRQKPMR